MPRTHAEPAPATGDDLDGILRAQDWTAIRARLFAIAFRRTGSRAHAEELADGAIVDCWDPRAAPWEPALEPDVLRHAMRVLGNKMSAERRKQRLRDDPRSRYVLAEVGSSAPTPAEALELEEARARSARIVQAARERLSEDVDRRVLDLSLRGVDKPAEQSAELGRAIGEIRRARERVKYAIRVTIEEDEARHAETRAFTGRDSRGARGR